MHAKFQKTRYLIHIRQLKQPLSCPKVAQNNMENLGFTPFTLEIKKGQGSSFSSNVWRSKRLFILQFPFFLVHYYKTFCNVRKYIYLTISIGVTTKAIHKKDQRTHQKTLGFTIILKQNILSPEVFCRKNFFRSSLIFGLKDLSMQLVLIKKEQQQEPWEMKDCEAFFWVFHHVF